MNDFTNKTQAASKMTPIIKNRTTIILLGVPDGNKGTEALWIMVKAGVYYSTYNSDI